jgi:ureidoacrylate peracid hydrolase
MSQLKIPKSESCLLIIDMQKGFVDAKSEMGKSPSGTEKQRAIVPAIRHLVEIFHKEKIPVIWSQQEHFPEDKTRAGRLIQPHSKKQGFLPCLRGSSETEFYGPLHDLILPSDHIVQKHRASVFFNTNLETKLRMLGTRFLFIAGCNTEFCVESTVRDAYARDFQIIVVDDCVAGIRQEFHENSLRVMAAYFAEVLPSKSLGEILT